MKNSQDISRNRKSCEQHLSRSTEIIFDANFQNKKAETWSS